MVVPDHRRVYRDEDAVTARRALVLGSGGHAAGALETGMIAGLAEAAIDLHAADLVVGTSAGSRVAVALASGHSFEDAFLRQLDPRLHTHETGITADLREWRAGLTRAREGGGSTRDILERIGSLPAPLQSSATSEWRDETALRIADQWPERPVRVVAVDADAGERRAFDRTSGVALSDALAASSAVPGLRPLVTIDGHRCCVRERRWRSSFPTRPQRRRWRRSAGACWIHSSARAPRAHLLVITFPAASFGRPPCYGCVRW